MKKTKLLALFLAGIVVMSNLTVYAEPTQAELKTKYETDERPYGSLAFGVTKGGKSLTYHYTLQSGENVLDSTKAVKGEASYFGDTIALFNENGLDFKGVMDQVVITKEKHDRPDAAIGGVQYTTACTMVSLETKQEVSQKLTFDRQKGLLDIDLGEGKHNRFVAIYHHDRKDLKNWSKDKRTDLPDAWYNLTVQGFTDGRIKILKEDDCVTISGDGLEKLVIKIAPNPNLTVAESWPGEFAVVNHPSWESDPSHQNVANGLTNEKAVKIHLDKSKLHVLGEKFISCEIVPLPAEEL